MNWLIQHCSICLDQPIECQSCSKRKAIHDYRATLLRSLSVAQRSYRDEQWPAVDVDNAEESWRTNITISKYFKVVWKTEFTQFLQTKKAISKEFINKKGTSSWMQRSTPDSHAWTIWQEIATGWLMFPVAVTSRAQKASVEAKNWCEISCLHEVDWSWMSWMSCPAICWRGKRQIYG